VNPAETRIEGVLVVDKPKGPTSHDVVARVRRALGERRIGHTGTLDPMATGVLPLVIGRATRLARFFSPGRKEYLADLRLGVATDTYDAEGQPIPQPAAMPPPRREAVEAALDRFQGTYLQTPPAFSAKKIGGVRAHTLARRQEAVVPAPVRVTVERVELLALDDDRLRLLIVCSAGFYVRSLAHDLGQVLGCGAHLTALRRIRSGEFGIAEAVALESVERERRSAIERLLPLNRLLESFPGVHLTPQGTDRAAHGSAITPSDLVSAPDPGFPGDAPHVRLLTPQGALVAIAEARHGVLHPIVVLV
jgi:tRNA pseudouridine55 synthase